MIGGKNPKRKRERIWGTLKGKEKQCETFPFQHSEQPRDQEKRPNGGGKKKKGREVTTGCQEGGGRGGLSTEPFHALLADKGGRKNYRKGGEVPQNEK